MAKLFLLAGEASGDRIGAGLISNIRALRPDVDFIGVGGEAMASLGLKSLFPMDDLAVMGYRDVILRLPLLLWRARQVIRSVLKSQPEVVVLIDAQVFSKVVAKGLKRRGYRGRILLYVAPAVWAWGAERAKTLADIFDEVLSVLPFEPQAMRSLGGPETAYVGHPAVAEIAMRAANPATGPLLLLPGSRRSEIRKHLPMFKSVAEQFAQHGAIDGFVVISTRSQAAFISSFVDEWNLPVQVVVGNAARSEAMARAVAAVAVSGTVTLELALAGVPHVLTYIAEPAQVRIFEKASTSFIGLPNIVAGHQVVPELLFAGRGDPEAIGGALATLLEGRERREKQRSDFQEIRTLMEKGAPEAPLQNPAMRVLSHLDADQR